MGALRDRGVPVEVASVEEAEERIAQGSSATYWIDTLHLGRFGELADLAGQSARVCLLAHYLPSLCAARSDWTAHVLGDDERTALDRAKAVLAPSATFAETLRRVGAKGSVVVVEPGLRGFEELAESWLRRPLVNRATKRCERFRSRLAAPGRHHRCFVPGEHRLGVGEVSQTAVVKLERGVG
jgi:hypothetical protein